MNRKIWLTVVMCLCAAMAGAAEAQPESRPNITLIFTDDQGLTDLSIHGGQRVPFMAAWPGRIAAVQVFDQAVWSLDAAVTTLALAVTSDDPGRRLEIHPTRRSCPISVRYEGVGKTDGP